MENKTEIETNLWRHDGSVRSVTFNNTGMILASGANDNSIKLWNIKTL